MDCVFNGKEDATNEAWRQLDAGHLDGVKVNQEIHDEATNTAKVTTTLKRLKGDEKKAASRRSKPLNQYTAHTGVKSSKSKSKVNKKSGATGNLALMVITVCLVLPGLVGAAFYVVDRF